jgi:hypothetical protein
MRLKVFCGPHQVRSRMQDGSPIASNPIMHKDVSFHSVPASRNTQMQIHLCLEGEGTLTKD